MPNPIFVTKQHQMRAASSRLRRRASDSTRWVAVFALVIGSALFIGGSSAQVEPEAIPSAQADEPVPVDVVDIEELDLSESGIADDGRSWNGSDVAWPSAAAAMVTPSAERQTADGLPVTLSAQVDVGQTTVQVFDQSVSRESGLSGVVVELDSEHDGTVELEIDYSGFAEAFGAGWSTRLRLIELTDCEPAEGCSASNPLASTNNADHQSVTASVSSDGVYAVSAAAADESGDYAATDLQAAGSWTAGGSAGGFSYNYPLRTPPAAGPVPSLGLSYSSQSHDGRTSGSNNQASWIGDGWSYEPGYIERTYKSCAIDQEGSNNNPDKTGDKCWDGDSDAMTLSLNGTNTALVKDDATGKWRAASDANWKIQKLGSKATSSSATTEYWKVTTTDGTQYFFAGEAASSKSRWTVPVFGNHSGEACRASAFKDSMCQQAWRWMVDKVVDVHGNQVVYTYATETGHYGAAGDENKRTSYIRGGHLTRIDYGLRSDDASVTPTGRVVFDLADRCLSDCGTSGSPKTSNWPDTPWDLTCETAPCTDQRSPSFFSSKRLESIRTQVADGSTFRDVDSWKLEHEFKDYGDDSQVVLWLKSIQHTGHVGGSITLPKTSFAGQAMPNRVETQSGIPEIWRWRISAVTTETGGVIGVNYSEPDCGNGDLPSTEQTNSRLCYPVYWTPDQYAEAEKDWFHKYVVTSIVEQDGTAGMVPITTNYEYSTTGGGVSALWAWDDGEFTDDDHRTYSQWRGYSRVTTKTGDPAEGSQLTSRTQYYRGMDDQPLPDGSKRSVQLTDSQGNTVTDHRALAGMVFEAVTLDGAEIDSAAVSKYWTKRTASRSHDGGRLEAWMSGESEKTARKRLTSTAWHTTRTKTGYDDYGRVTQVDDLGDTTTAADDLCSRTEYADNTSSWILDAVARSETVSVACTVTPNRPDDVLSDTRTYFDGSTTFKAAPTKGLPTSVEVIDSWGANGAEYLTTATSTFDALGRQVSATDALSRETTTSYTPAGPGPVTSSTVTNPLGHTVTSYLEPAWGTVTATVDANNRRTDLTFDALGRSLAVWLPGQSKASNALPHHKFSYEVSRTAPSTVTSERLTARSTYVTSIQLFDSLLRPIQTQSDTPVGGRLITETDYNTRGEVIYSSGPNYDSTAEPNGTFVRVEPGADHARTHMTYDALGRTVKEEFWSSNVRRWETTYSYGGSPDGFLSTVTPPDGAAKTAVLTNARGQEIEKRQYHGGGYDAVTYAYTPRGELASVVDAVGNTWSYEYDLRGNTVRTSDPDVGVVTATYDAVGQKTSSTDARGVTVSTVYDQLGRTVETWEGAPGSGVLVADHEYDTVSGGVGMAAKTRSYAGGELAITTRIGKYSPAGKPTQFYTTVSPLVGLEKIAGTYLATQTYNVDGSISGGSLPAVAGLFVEDLTYGYSEHGLPTRLVGSWSRGSATYVDAASYTAFGELKERTLGSGSNRVYEAFHYEDGTRRKQTYTLSRTDTTQARVAELSYQYDDAGNILSIADSGGAGGAAERQCFQYDELRQLSEAWSQAGTADCAGAPSTGVMGGPAPYWSSYQHDVTGNRISQTTHTPSGESVEQQYQYPAAGQPGAHTVSAVETAGSAETYAYDESGNLIERNLFAKSESLTWNALGKVESITGATGTTRMIYDAAGNRVARIDDNGDATVFAAQTEISYTAATDSVSAVRSYTHNGDTIASRSTIDGLIWLASDHHGTATWAIAMGSMAVTVRRKDPYGNARGGAVTWAAGQKGFVGGVEDPTGLVHIGARSYDPTLGKFISADPIRDFTDPQQINGYTYANANPVTMSDPTGMMRFDPVTGEGVGVPTLGLCTKSGYCLGAPRNPTDHGPEDDDFPYDPNAEPTSADHAAWAKWQAMARACQFGGAVRGLYEACDMYSHYLDGDGEDVYYNLHPAYEDDAKMREWMNAQMVAIMLGAKEIWDITGYTQYSVTGPNWNSKLNPETEEWQKTVGSVDLWSSADVRIEGSKMMIEITVHAEDRYNFNDGDVDIHTGIPDSENGRFAQLGWADAFNSHGSATFYVEWDMNTQLQAAPEFEKVPGDFKR